jgi:hypothetical protein
MIGAGIVTSTIRPSGRVINHCRKVLERRASVPNRVKSFQLNGLAGFSSLPNPKHPLLWLSDVDTSCVGVYCFTPPSNTSTPGRGALITPRHHIQAAHAKRDMGDTIYFQSQDGSIVSRTIANQEDLLPDLTLNLLSSDLPNSIKPAKVLPSGDAYFTSQDFTTGVPCVVIDRNLVVSVFRWAGYWPSDYIKISPLANGDTLESLADVSLDDGDSGAPVFLVINGEVVLLGTPRSPTQLSGPHNIRAAVEGAIDLMGRFGHSLQEIDLSGFSF